MAFALNQRVRWVSQAGGHSTEKVGTVVAVVTPGTLPSRKDFPELYAGSGVGLSRKHESYIVRVESSKLRGSTVSRLYWPRTSALTAVVETPAEEGLSLAAFIDVLTTLKEHVGGEAKMVLHYHSARVTMGPSPAMPVTGASAGIDWNHGKVFVHTKEQLAAPSAELEAVRKRFDEMAYKLSCARRILLSTSPEAERIEQLKQALGG